MDSLTHIVLGACIGEALAGKKLGKKAMLLGAIAQSIPDLDFITAWWMDTPSSLLAHRGFTHSFLFAIIITFLLALLFSRWRRLGKMPVSGWILFLGTQLLVHIGLDAFNNYGVGWFEPFSHYRVSFNTIYVADPFFFIAPAIAFFVLASMKGSSPKRKWWWKFGIGISFCYLAYCTVNKLTIDRTVREIISAQHLPHSRYFTTPTPLNNLLWFVVTGNDSGYYVGFRSVFDRGKNMHFEYFPRNDYLLDSIAGRKDIRQLIRFSQQFYTIEDRDGALVFNDLRFGQVVGWQNPREEFVFHYFLQYPRDNKLVVQRGRFAKWNRQSIHSLIERIKGNQVTP